MKKNLTVIEKPRIPKRAWCMSKLRLLTTMAILSALSAMAWSGDDKCAEPDIEVTTTLVLDLADGSHILGEPGFTSISLRTPFDKIEIPLKHLRLIKPHEDHKTAFVHLRNGDRLTGVLEIENPLKLKTLMGGVSVDLQHIKNAGVLKRITLSKKLKEALVLYFPFDKPAQKVSKTTVPITRPPVPMRGPRWGQQRGSKKFEGMVKDQSGKGNHGGNYGGKYTPAGIVNGAFEFDGNSYVRCEDNPTLDLADAMTITFWVKPGPLVADYAAQIIHKAPRKPITGKSMILLYYFGTKAETTPGTIRPYATLDRDLVDVKGFCAKEDVWYHLAIVYNGDDMRFYKDGVEIGVHHGSGLATNNEPLFVGKGWGPNHGHGIKGMIDELMIFNQALSADQVKQLYDAQKSHLDLR